jgi:hypothetical protein
MVRDAVRCRRPVDTAGPWRREGIRVAGDVAGCRLPGSSPGHRSVRHRSRDRVEGRHAGRRVREPSDRVVVSIHWESNWGTTRHGDTSASPVGSSTPGSTWCTDGRSSHRPRAIELHRGHLVLYGCGDFVDDYDDYEGIGGRRDGRHDGAPAGSRADSLRGRTPARRSTGIPPLPRSHPDRSGCAGVTAPSTPGWSPPLRWVARSGPAGRRS